MKVPTTIDLFTWSNYVNSDYFRTVKLVVVFWDTFQYSCVYEFLLFIVLDEFFLHVLKGVLINDLYEV